MKKIIGIIQIIGSLLWQLVLYLPKKICGYCPIHGWFHRVRRYRMNTAYVKDEANYANGCTECEKETFAYYKEKWTEY
jgi:hypothetical protein